MRARFPTESGTIGTPSTKNMNRTGIMKNAAIVLTVAILCCGCASSLAERINLNSVVWMQSSGEYRALVQGAYNSARRDLDDALADKTWTALLTQVPENDEEADALGKLPPAVILDIDETVLSTLPYQAWLLKNEQAFAPISWHAWISEASAEALPGALDFVHYAMEKGVTVFYLSNRAGRGAFDSNRNGRIDPGEEQVNIKAFTVSNLLKLGFLPQQGTSNEDSVLLRAETDRDGKAKKGWASSDKTVRREFLAAGYRVVLVMGDNLNDFSRHINPESQGARWGRSWILLPNPSYGHWERRLYGTRRSLSREEKIRIKLDSLDTWK